MKSWDLAHLKWWVSDRSGWRFRVIPDRGHPGQVTITGEWHATGDKSQICWIISSRKVELSLVVNDDNTTHEFGSQIPRRLQLLYHDMICYFKRDLRNTFFGFFTVILKLLTIFSKLSKFFLCRQMKAAACFQWIACLFFIFVCFFRSACNIIIDSWRM